MPVRLLRFLRPLPLLAAVLVLLLSGAAFGVQAQASPLVPTDAPAYRDLDALLARGLGGDLVRTQRPYSRMTFARAARAARESVSGTRGPPAARLEEALRRLEEEFARELTWVCDRDDCPDPARYAELAAVSGDLSLADSPLRGIPTGYGPGESRIDANVNPLLQRNLGRPLADGWTVGFEGRVDAGLGRHVAAQLRPRLSVLEAGDGTEEEVGLLAAYVRGVFGKVAVDLGRNHVTHGFSGTLSPALSTNPRALTMVRVYNERPGRLPWILSGLGDVAFGVTVAGMGEERDTPGSVISLLEASLKPHPNLELGALFLSHQGGEGAPEATWWERVRDGIPFLLRRRGLIATSPEPPISDKVFGLEAHLRLPGPGLELYAELASTDDHNLFEAPEQAFWHEAVWTGGARLTGLGSEGRVDLWAEATHSGVRPYTHHQFTSGLTVDGRVIGSPLGPLATGVHGGVDWTAPDHRIAWMVAREQYEPDTYRNRGFDGSSSTWNWTRVEDEPDEIRLRSTVSWTRQPAVTGLRTTLLLGWERVTRFAFTESDRSNLLAQLRAEYRW